MIHRPDSTASCDRLSSWRRLFASLKWTTHSYYLMSAFLMTLGLIGYIWWPLAEEVLSFIDWERWWLYIDWLLLWDFFIMSVLLMAGADLRVDSLIIFVGFMGGFVIESWGTQTQIWTYYTLERPPLWIVPAWPIASLAIDRLVRLSDALLPKKPNEKLFKIMYWLIFPAFLSLMLIFVWPTINRSMTIAALTLCILLTISPTDYRIAALNFAAGSGLGYFLELWGTTRLCWTYYTLQTPPLFAVLAHGMAAVAFWRAGLLVVKTFSFVRSAFKARSGATA